MKTVTSYLAKQNLKMIHVCITFCSVSVSDHERRLINNFVYQLKKHYGRNRILTAKIQLVKDAKLKQYAICNYHYLLLTATIEIYKLSMADSCMMLVQTKKIFMVAMLQKKALIASREEAFSKLHIAYAQSSSSKRIKIQVNMLISSAILNENSK